MSASSTSSSPSTCSTSPSQSMTYIEMFNDEEYTLEKTLVQGKYSNVFRAKDNTKERSVIIKIHNMELPSPRLRNKYMKEYEVGLKCNDNQNKHVVEYYGMKKIGRRLAVIMQDFDGVPLMDYLKSPMELEKFFHIALQLVDGLSSIHHAGVMHQTICPRHILINPNTLEIKYIDFGNSSLLNKQYQPVINSKNFEHHLEYISPEQSGRMNKDVDYRTDYYSLGVVMYHMICGVVPFTASDNSKLIYSHIAKSPTPPHLLVKSIPIALSNLILKLLAKNADDRYQSTYGIKCDLVSLIEGKTNFEIATHDVNSVFKLTQKLYGRENEISQLLNSFHEITSGQVANHFLLVYGYSGIGKSSLINELHKPLLREKGYFISGKFDQFKRNIPYSSIIQAFQQLILTILTEAEEKVQYWRNNIQKALGQQGQVLIDVIPELQNLIGPQPSVPELTPTENQNRFKRIFTEMFAIFAKKSHPLILFLDDLQWADLPTLSLIEALMLSQSTQYLLLIGAFRDNEVPEHHPLAMMLNKIERKKKLIHIPLKPLKLDDVNLMIADSLNEDEQSTKELSSIVTRRTQGNPFFTIIFLQSLYNDGLIKFNNLEGKWKWDTMKITASASISENVIEMMTVRLKKLAKETQTILSLAASIGNKFDLKVLSVVYGKSEQETGRVLWPAVKDGLVLQYGEEYNFAHPNSDFNIDNISYQFLHDRVQQSAYELTDREERSNLHLKIGRLLVQNSSEEQLEDKLFDIMVHFRVSLHMIDNSDEKIQLAQLFLKATDRAKTSSAYQPACDYAQSGIDLLPNDKWTSQYELTLQLYKLLAECEYMRGNYEVAEKLYPVITTNCKSLLDTMGVHMITVNQFEVQQRYSELFNLVCDCLTHFGISFPQDDDSVVAAIEKERQELESLLGNRQISDLIALPEMTDKYHLVAFKLLCSLWAPLYCLPSMPLLTLASMRMAAYTIMHGHTSLSTIAYSSCGFAYFMWLDEAVKGTEFCKLAVNLLDVFPYEPYRCKALMMYGCGPAIASAGLEKAVPMVDQAFELALEHGDIPFATYSAHHMLTLRYFKGDCLSSTYKMYERNMLFLKKSNTFIHYYALSVTQPFRVNLCLEELNEEDFLQKIEASSLVQGVYYAGKLQAQFWSDASWSEIAITAEILNSEQYGDCLHGLYIREESNFVTALAYMHEIHSGRLSEEKTKKYKDMNKFIFNRLRQMTEFYAPNFSHKLLFLRAERARLKGKHMKALKLFDQSIHAASTANFIQYEALANEYMAMLWHEQQMYKYAKTHIQEAYYLYNEWGSSLKLQHLKKAFYRDIQELPSSQLDETELMNHLAIEVEDEDIAGSDDSGDSSVDLLAVMKASKTISTEQNLEDFLDYMMKIMIENSCATRGVFLLEETDGELLVVAEGTADSVMIDTIRAIPLQASSDYPFTIINYVARTKELVILGDCSKPRNQFENDPHLSQVKSVLCAPIINHKKFKGVIYLENNLITNAFTEKRAKVIGILSAQMALILENARFSALLESEKKYRSLAAELAVVKKRLEEFIDVLCHELRNPLSGIAGSNEAMNDLLVSFEQFLVERNYFVLNEEGREFVREHMREVKDILKAFSISSQHLKDIVDTVLTVSMLENQNVKLQSIAFNPSEMLNNVAIMFKAKLSEKQLGLITEFPDEEYVVVGDPYRFKEVVINLLSNAIKFTDSGHIAIRYSLKERTDDHTSFEFEIEDTGIGMTQTERAKLFRAFSQANSQTYAKYGGSGLGLKISKQIIELMGGSIRVHSEKDKGSKFVFNIQFRNLSEENGENESQRSPQQQQEQQALQSADKSPLKSGVHVLIAEDNAINAKLLRRLIERSGNSCEVANNGLEAFQMYTQNPKKFNIILMDLEMPIMSGLEATTAIREEERKRKMKSNIVIVGVSANARCEFEQTAYATGMQDFVKKPYLAHDILVTIDKWTR